MLAHVLTPMDDFPVHQTAEPVAQPATGDRNFYDRYFFNGYDRTGEVYFAAAFGVYPNRSVVDASFSVLRGGVQTSLHASRRSPLDRTDTTCGPVAVAVLEPLRRLAVRVGGNSSDITADLVFTARTAPLEEPRFTMRAGTHLVMDYTRLTQFGSWEGSLHVDGERLDLVGEEVLGSRDRSWGVRRVGEREVEAPGPLPQFFWLWAPINFDGRCVHFDAQEDGDGRRWHANGDTLVVGADGTHERMASVDHAVRWRPGTRRSDGATITLRPFAGEPLRVDLEPIVDFQMLGLGYLHPEWGHGMWKGEEAVAVESWKVADLDPLAPPHLHVQQLCRARTGDGEDGIGVLEQLVIGPHAPSGFTQLLDGAR